MAIRNFVPIASTMTLRLLKSSIDIIAACGYDVSIMATLATRLVKDGNSKAVRLPSTVLAMSGLSDEVLLEVENGQVTIRPLNSNPRKEWAALIKKEIANNPKALNSDVELDDWDVTLNDGLD